MNHVFESFPGSLVEVARVLAHLQGCRMSSQTGHFPVWFFFSQLVSKTSMVTKVSSLGWYSLNP